LLRACPHDERATQALPDPSPGWHRLCDIGHTSQVADLHLFGALPRAELQQLVAVARRRTFAHNEIVFHRGDPADSLHLIRRGRFVSRIRTQLGETAAVAVHGPGEAFGELALVDPDTARSTTVAALEAGETLAVHRDDFERLRKQYPTVNEVLVRLLARRTRYVSERLVEALFSPAETRVLRRVCELAQLYGARIPLTQDEIAGLAGTSRATVNRVLRAEVGQGTVSLSRGRTVVLDPDRLAQRARRER
jgi:CRP-like cAMP-binding protein